MECVRAIGMGTDTPENAEREAEASRSPNPSKGTITTETKHLTSWCFLIPQGDRNRVGSHGRQENADANPTL